jgi:hypothetical protein
MSALQDHWWQFGAAVSGIVILGFVCLAALIYFTRWVVHTDFTNLATALVDGFRKDIGEITARLDGLAGKYWTDARITDAISNLRSIIAAHELYWEEQRKQRKNPQQ